MQVSQLNFISGEIRKLIMTVSCDDEICNDFIISTAKAELLDKDKATDLSINISKDGKEIGIIIDTTGLQGYYQLLITYSINDEVLKKRMDVRIT
ncbi:hypothetical protein [Coprobacillus sp. AF33-1AC]|uniref:hypothetical protein n=1 Tax=Coprobacillus sp. AF33-1AC TaxID=2292032 RepID=UPI000E46CC1E|nr:hypothetical protein [Coprobacillus sp. AF33-1AC]RHM59646.1 hypothetical protein DWZ53_08865 [Coprobacillus sp. AF33-1AC]